MPAKYSKIISKIENKFVYLQIKTTQKENTRVKR